jgi:ABC-2 type transport system ATP-binding protein
MLQTAGVPDMLAVGELIHLFRSYYPKPRTFADIVALAGVADIVKRRYGKLSGGQQRRAQFALSIAGTPEILFLDEPTTGLDINARETLWKTIRTLAGDGCAIVLTTHYLEEAEALANRVCVLSQGHVVAEGDVQQIRARVGQRRVSCVSTLEPAAIAAWPNVRNAARVGDRIEIVTDAAENLVRRLLSEDVALSELEVRRAGLAEAFVEITKEAA